MKDTELQSSLTRRQVMTLGASGLVATLTPLSAIAEPEDMRAAQKQMFGDRTIREGRVTLALPPIAENGYSVPIEINVDSPMTPDDYVKTITVFSPQSATCPRKLSSHAAIRARRRLHSHPHGWDAGRQCGCRDE